MVELKLVLENGDLLLQCTSFLQLINLATTISLYEENRGMDVQDMLQEWVQKGENCQECSKLQETNSQQTIE